MALKPVFNTKALGLILRNILLQIRKNTGKKLSHLIKGTDVHGQSRARNWVSSWDLFSSKQAELHMEVGGFLAPSLLCAITCFGSLYFGLTLSTGLGSALRFASFLVGGICLVWERVGEEVFDFANTTCTQRYFYSLAFLSEGLGLKPLSKRWI